MATKRDVRYIIELWECTQHFVAIWNRGDNFLFYDPDTGCYERGLSDYKPAILRYLKEQYGASRREHVHVDRKVE